ncbi:hypothetical protein CVT24_008486 [Panaeolus cyanescens]|uniref:Uncharacterized protein n=1 Tax=Panaeolus cyanescens TaxID=181874 RepID=A0A409YJB4_9AGAR|nr:hypothetical protein CVT24_008486 [Panaeolus cyanescens]
MPTSRVELITTGTVSVKARSNWSDEKRGALVILLAGPTGSGKSSFIEALGNNKSLGISKNQLEGFTQTVTAYHVKNMMANCTRKHGIMIPVCLLDSPGFCDTNISEIEVIEQVRSWLDNWPRSNVHINVILYFCPINGTRIPGSQRRIIELIKSINRKGNGQEATLTIVTTMWDQVCSKRLQKRAEDNFAYLRDSLFKDMIEGGTGLTTFANTQKSALNIIDSCVELSNTAEYNVVNSISLGRDELRVTPYGRQLYSDLLGRIEEAWVRKSSLESDLAQTDSDLDPDLNALLKSQLQETIHILDKFGLQLAEFGRAPDGVQGLHRDSDSAKYMKQMYGRQLYANLLGPLEGEWKTKLYLEEELMDTRINSNPNHKAYFEDVLCYARRRLPNLAKQFAEFGPPPDGVSGPQGDLAAYVESQPWLEESQAAASEPVTVPQPAPLEPAAFGRNNDHAGSGVERDASLDLDHQPQTRELPVESATPPQPDTGNTLDNFRLHSDVTKASTERLQPIHQSRLHDAAGAPSGAKRSRLRQFFARLLFWRKPSLT